MLVLNLSPASQFVNRGREIISSARGGEILADTVKHGGDRRSSLQRESLKDVGISHTQSHRWQKMASVLFWSWKRRKEKKNLGRFMVEGRERLVPKMPKDSAVDGVTVRAYNTCRMIRNALFRSPILISRLL